MTNKHYKNLFSPSKPVDYDYDITHLEEGGYAHKWRIDKDNPVKEEIISDLKDEEISYSVINHTERKRMIDIWIKK